MNLRDYLAKNNITQEEFAKKIGYTRTAFSHVMNFQYPVSKRFAYIVELATNGDVKGSDLLKKSKTGMKRRAEQKASAQEGGSDMRSSCRGVCKICKKKLNEIEL